MNSTKESIMSAVSSNAMHDVYLTWIIIIIIILYVQFYTQ